MKKCSECGAEKDELEFYIDRRSSDGLTHNCKECRKANAKKNYRPDEFTLEKKRRRREAYKRWKERNPERYREFGRKAHAKKSLKPVELRNRKPANREKVIPAWVLELDIRKRTRSKKKLYPHIDAEPGAPPPG